MWGVEIIDTLYSPLNKKPPVSRVRAKGDNQGASTTPISTTISLFSGAIYVGR
jgi:hypothetical protein